jgi:hypothetical protein
MKEFKPIIKNFSDAILGYVLGGVAAEYMYLYRLLMKREPNNKEMGEMYNLLIRRSNQLSSKIREVMMK